VLAVDGVSPKKRAGSLSLICPLSWLPLRPRFRAGSGLLQESQHIECACGVFEKLLEAAWAAVVGQVLVARGRVNWTVQKHVFHGLGQLAARASDLVWGV
jgi:hypothetical protein